jgi:hypothetical protein
MKDITWHLGSKRKKIGHQNFEYTSLKSWARHCLFTPFNRISDNGTGLRDVSVSIYPWVGAQIPEG